jgi:AcrR family transcriptional regulator
MFLSMAESRTVKRVREPHQLPPGRHGLSREFVLSNQRERIMAAVVEVCATAGYVSMSVEDIVVASGVSRRTFYDNFQGKEEVFLAALDQACARLIGTVDAAYDPEDGLVDRSRKSVRALLDFMAAEPASANICIVEVLAAGPAAIERRKALLQAFAAMLDAAAAAELPKAKRPSPLVAETLVGGIYDVVHTRVQAGRYAELPTLLPELVFSLLLPYAGAEVAHEVLKQERRRVKRTTPAG